MTSNCLFMAGNVLMHMVFRTRVMGVKWLDPDPSHEIRFYNLCAPSIGAERSQP